MDLPASVAEQLRLAALARALAPRAAAPYAAHLRIETHGRTLDVLLGTAAPRSREVTLLDWESSPLTELCFSCDPGEEYELDVGDREVTGRLLARTCVGFERGELVEVDSPSGRFVRDASGAWTETPRAELALRPRPPGTPPSPSPMEVVLDPTQQHVVDLDPNRSVLILGEAGFGKTTVALRRLLRLQKLGDEEFRAAVIVPTEGLSRMTEVLLERMGVRAQIEVWHYDTWAVAQARLAFPSLRQARTGDTPAAVIRFKRHGALRSALAALAADPPKLVDDDGHDLRHGTLVHRADLEHLFGDRLLMEQVRREAGDTLRAGDVLEVLAHTRAQFRLTSEQEFAHVVHRESITTIDGRGLNDGTPEEVAGALDTEDFAPLFELDRLRAERTGRKPAPLPSYDCLVLDEGQELAPLELALLGRCVEPTGTVIVAGDDAQQVDPAAGFGGWSLTMGELRQRDHATSVLEMNHRCPPEVTALAQPLRSPNGVGEGRGPAIRWIRQASPLQLLMGLTEAVRELISQDPTSSIAIITRTPESIRALARHLHHGLSFRVALEGRFDFRPGLVLSCVPEVKGLEFDHVIVPDATADAYPDTGDSRRSLYVAVTRATNQLVLCATGRTTPLLRWG